MLPCCPVPCCAAASLRLPVNTCALLPAPCPPAGLLEAAFGPAFFFWREQRPPGPAAVDAGQPLPLDAGTAQQQERLRQLVLVLLEAAASLPAASSNLPEVSALMQLLRQHPQRHALVAPACRLLLRLLGCAPVTTLAALQEQQLLTALPRLLAQQQAGEQPRGERGVAAEHVAVPAREVHAAAGSQAGEEEPTSPRTAAEALALEDARCAALELLGAFLRCGQGRRPGSAYSAALLSVLLAQKGQAAADLLPPPHMHMLCPCSTHSSIQQAALATWDPVAALFSLLLRPAAPSRRLAMDSVSPPGEGIACA